ncbi:MAG: putative toxin-antitoxin system toxin component, PIN family [Candidatus Binatia bacterium]
MVLDTNVVLSALVFAQGRLAPLRQAWQQGRCNPLASTATTAELMRALQYPKFKLSAEEQKELFSDYLPYCTVVRIPATPPKTPPCRDPLDIPFLQLALVSKADHLVTGDKDLLNLTDTFACSILTVDQLLRLLAKN